MTEFELLQRCLIGEGKPYVYMWLYKTDEGNIPFYVGMGTNLRYKNKGSRSAKFKEFLDNHECYPILCATNLTYEMARSIEKKLKTEIKNRGISLLDGEDDREERKLRQAEGIAAKKASGNWDDYGRPRKESSDFEKFLKKQKDGELSVRECCEQLGISRATWYNKLKEVS